MKRFLAPSLALAVVSMGAWLVAAEIESGLEVGDDVAAFNVKDITGPAKGTSLCYRCRYGSRPVVGIFTRGTKDPVANLVKQVDETVGKNEEKKMAAFVVLLTEDSDAATPQLEKLAKDKEISKTPLTVFDGVAGPPEYKIGEKAEVTVMMWVEGKVKVNQAFAKAEDLNAEKIKELVKNTGEILK
jgi:hypothetical protein